MIEIEIFKVLNSRRLRGFTRRMTVFLQKRRFRESNSSGPEADPTSTPSLSGKVEPRGSAVFPTAAYRPSKSTH